MACTLCYKDWISCGNEQLFITGTLAASTAYIWILRNKESIYSGSATTNVNGNFVIPVSELPLGLLNPYSGTFELSVVADDAYQCSTVIWNNSAYCTKYDCITFEVVNGTADKNTLGCPCELL